MAYGVQDWVSQITNAKNSGNNGLAYAIFNGLQGQNGQGGALDVALRNAWGEDAAKQWINQGYQDYGAATGFDPRTGKYGIIGKDGSSSGTLAGWDPSQYSNTAGSEWLAGSPTLSYDPTAAKLGTATGVGMDGVTPLNADGTDPTAARIAGMFGGSAAKTGGMAKPALVGGTTPGATPGTVGGTAAAGVGAAAGAAAGASPAGTPWDYFNDEGYQFAKKEGMDGIQNSAAARGGLQSGATLKALADYNSGLANQYYGDAWNRYNTANRNARSDYQDDRNYGRSVYTDDRDYAENNRRYDQGFGYQAALNDRNFNEDQRRYDQGFNYTASSGDRDAALSTLRYLAGLGSSNTASSAGLDQWIAQLTGQNTMTGAGAGAAGAQSGASQINQLISMIMQQLTGNSMINTVTP